MRILCSILLTVFCISTYAQDSYTSKLLNFTVNIPKGYSITTKLYGPDQVYQTIAQEVIEIKDTGSLTISLLKYKHRGVTAEDRINDDTEYFFDAFSDMDGEVVSLKKEKQYIANKQTWIHRTHIRILESGTEINEYNDSYSFEHGEILVLATITYNKQGKQKQLEDILFNAIKTLK